MMTDDGPPHTLVIHTSSRNNMHTQSKIKLGIEDGSLMKQGLVIMSKFIPDTYTLLLNQE
jgi:hypothetical protein